MILFCLLKSHSGLYAQLSSKLKTPKSIALTMIINVDTVKKIANLARIEVKREELGDLATELSDIVSFMEELKDVDVANISPMTSVTPMNITLRDDQITDGDNPEEILRNAPDKNEGFFAVPKVIE